MKTITMKWLVAAQLILTPLPVLADYWNAPTEITVENTTVNFQLDSTWHKFDGVANQITGKVWLADQADYQSIRAEVEIPVSSLDTDNSARDEKLREVMSAEEFPKIIFKLNPITDLCDPETVLHGSSCEILVQGELTIHGVTKVVQSTAVVRRIDNKFRVEGDLVINWRDFGVKDPSILIAKVYEEVLIHVVIDL